MPFEFDPVPALEHIYHLELDVMEVALGNGGLLERATACVDVRVDQTAGGFLRTQVAIDHVWTQAVALEFGVGRVADMKFLHGPFAEVAHRRLGQNLVQGLVRLVVLHDVPSSL